MTGIDDNLLSNHQTTEPNDASSIANPCETWAHYAPQMAMGWRHLPATLNSAVRERARVSDRNRHSVGLSLFCGPHNSMAFGCSMKRGLRFFLSRTLSTCLGFNFPYLGKELGQLSLRSWKNGLRLFFLPEPESESLALLPKTFSKISAISGTQISSAKSICLPYF